MSFSLNGKEVKHGNSKKGAFRVGNLKAGKYLVRAAKEGYDVDVAEQPAEVQKGEDKTVSFQFRRRSQAASVRVRLTRPVRSYSWTALRWGLPGRHSHRGDLKAMAHTFRAEKGKQFQASQKTVELTAGQTVDLDLRLTALPVPVEIRKTPPDSTVTYTRAGDPAVHTFTGTRLDLPEGDYTFTANADGYLERVANEHISWDSVHVIDLTQEPALPSLRDGGLGQGALGPERRRLRKKRRRIHSLSEAAQFCPVYGSRARGKELRSLAPALRE